MSRVRVPLLPAWARWLAVVAVAAVLAYASLLIVPSGEPIVEPPPLVPLDKWRHFLGYAGFGLSLAYATTDWELPRRRLTVLVLGVTVCYGVLIELAQGTVPYRYFSVADVYANALGAVVASPWFLLRSRVEFVPLARWVPGAAT